MPLWVSGPQFATMTQIALAFLNPLSASMRVYMCSHCTHSNTAQTTGQQTIILRMHIGSSSLPQHHMHILIKATNHFHSKTPIPVSPSYTKHTVPCLPLTVFQGYKCHFPPLLCLYSAKRFFSCYTTLLYQHIHL